MKVRLQTNQIKGTAQEMVDKLHLYIEKKIDKYYTIFHVNRSLLGCEYLCEAIKLSFEDNTLLHKGLTTRLYPLIAQKYEVTAMQVERAIRNLIKVCFDKEDICKSFSEMTEMPFTNRYNRPSNGELISLCCWRLKIKLQEDGIVID